MNERYLLLLLAVMLIGSICAFFLYVPILPLAVAVLMVVALIAMFSLGFYTGKNPQLYEREEDPFEEHRHRAA